MLIDMLLLALSNTLKTDFQELKSDQIIVCQATQELSAYLQSNV